MIQMKKGKIPGMSVVIVKGDKTIYQNGFGYADVDEGKMVTDKTLFEIGSNSKAFTGLAILKLKDDGLINLEESITTYIPWLKMNYKGSVIDVSVEEFLYHTSGVPFKTIDGIPVSDRDDALEETVRTLIDIELNSYPGKAFQYATINYDVLGLVIENVTGESYEKYISDNILKPLNLNNTYLFRGEDIKGNIATGYKLEFLEPQEYEAPVYRGNKPAGYYISNSKDMAKWLKIQLGTYMDSEFNKELIKQSHNPNRKVSPLGDGSSYGAGWFAYQKGGGEISHGANNPNYSSFIVFRPEKQIGIVLLSNINSSYVSYIGQGINEILQGNEYNRSIKDLNKSADLISILIICQFENIEKDKIQATLNNDTERISGFVNILIGGVTSAVTLICCFMYLGFVNIYALLLSVVMILLIASIYYFAGIYANKIGEESRDLQNRFFKFINDLIEGFKELSFNERRKNEFQADMDESCDSYRLKRGKSELAFANMFVIGELLFTLAIGAVVFVFPLILKNLDGTSIASYVFILLYMTGPVHGILNTIPNAIEVRISWKRINDLLNKIIQEQHKELEERDRKINEKIKLKLNQAEYEYNNKEGHNFKVGPIDYEFNSGEIVFITGGNGSGKSTLAKLISGLYRSSKGSITLNDAKIKESILSDHYSTIFSDFYLFDKLYGVDYKNKEEDIKRYLKMLQLDKKVDIEDGKFSTTKLSTGQKKRLALLVTYLEDRPIYLFDEWAADQDPDFISIRSFIY